MEIAMRMILASFFSAAVLLSLAGTGEAATKRKSSKNCDSYCQRFPNATPRQLKNARAYDKGGEYFEQDPNAHPVGSRGWWYLKEREGRGGGLRF
jgi:hypothetical protein